MHQIPTNVRNFAIKHRINVGRDQFGYYVREHGFIVESTRSKTPTAANALAMVKRYAQIVGKRGQA